MELRHDASRRAYLPTLYGLGDSVRDWAVTILEQCEDDEPVVVGNSVGGSCALEVAWAAPDQVRGVILVGTKTSVRRDPQARDEAVQLLRQDGAAAAWDRYWAPLFSARTQPEVVAAARRLAVERDVDYLITGVRAFYDRRDHSEFVRTWKRHVLVVSGARDRTPTPVTVARSIGGTSARQLIVEDSGHYVPLEQPHLFHRVLEEQMQILHA